MSAESRGYGANDRRALFYHPGGCSGLNLVPAPVKRQLSRLVGGSGRAWDALQVAYSEARVGAKLHHRDTRSDVSLRHPAPRGAAPELRDGSAVTRVGGRPHQLTAQPPSKKGGGGLLGRPRKTVSEANASDPVRCAAAHRVQRRCRAPVTPPRAPRPTPRPLLGALLNSINHSGVPPLILVHVMPPRCLVHAR